MKIRNLLFSSLLVTASLGWSQSLPQPTDLQPLESSQPCNQCTGTLLPGRTYHHPETRWGIISDLPESFGDYGVLYSTREVLPDNGAPEEMRKQRSSGGFTTINDSFDVFLFHLSKVPDLAARIVVYAKNNGEKPVTVQPHQVVKSEGIIGTQHDFESELGRRVLGRLWDRTTASASGNYPDITFGNNRQRREPAPAITIPPGEGRIVAYGKQFGSAAEDNPDASRNVNCFGYARVLLDEQSAGNADLEVSVIAIPAGPREQMQAEAEKLINTGAKTTDEVRMEREQQGCALGRAVGVYSNFFYQNDPVVIDASKLDEGGTSFPMALPEIQTAGCSDARQTTDLVLRPGYTRPDTIGNYIIEYTLDFQLINPSSEPQAVDLVFSKTGADIGLSYAVAVTDGPKNEQANAFARAQVKSLWAGPKQSAVQKSLLESPVVIQPGQQRTLHLRFLVNGNSSLPFFLGLQKASATATTGLTASATTTGSLETTTTP